MFSQPVVRRNTPNNTQTAKKIIKTAQYKPDIALTHLYSKKKKGGLGWRYIITVHGNALDTFRHLFYILESVQ